MDPTVFDVLLGRSTSIFHHVGNQCFRLLINKAADRHRACPTKREKTELVKLLRAIIENGGGRFLKRGDDGRWSKVEERVAREKISHALRDYASKKKDTTATSITSDLFSSIDWTFLNQSLITQQRPPRDLWKCLVLDTLQQQRAMSIGVQPVAVDIQGSQTLGPPMNPLLSGLKSTSDNLEQKLKTNQLVESQHVDSQHASGSATIGAPGAETSLGLTSPFSSYNQWNPPPPPSHLGLNMNADFALPSRRQMELPSQIGLSMTSNYALPSRGPMEMEKLTLDSLNNTNSASSAARQPISTAQLPFSQQSSSQAFAGAAKVRSDLDDNTRQPMGTSQPYSQAFAGGGTKSRSDVPCDDESTTTQPSAIPDRDHEHSSSRDPREDSVATDQQAASRETNLGDPARYSNQQLDDMIVAMFRGQNS